MEVCNISINKEFASEAKSFLESCCKNIVKKVDDFNMKETIRLIGEKLFYSHFINKIQIKFFIYKLNEQKLKKFAEDNYYKTYEIDADNKKKWEVCKKDTNTFLNSIKKKVAADYLSYQMDSLLKVLIIQKSFRGHLRRIINKMEMMNLQLETETKEAQNRVKRKTIEKNNIKKIPITPDH